MQLSQMLPATSRDRHGHIVDWYSRSPLAVRVGASALIFIAGLAVGSGWVSTDKVNAVRDNLESKIIQLQGQTTGTKDSTPVRCTPAPPP